MRIITCGNLCVVLNFLSWIILSGLLSVPVIILLKGVVLKVIICVVLFFLCGFIEEKIISRHVNSFAEYVLKKDKD